jgi:DNA polymerase
VAIVGEGPGRWEDSTGRPFCGMAGQELDETYLRLAGLNRSDVFVTNMVQCRQERNGVDVRPGADLLQCCSGNHLYEELATVTPEIVVLCGATACTMFPDIDLELEHGFPRKIASTWYVPMYHPAAGLHETRYMMPMLEDWERLGMWMRGRWEVPDGQQKLAVYHLVRSWREISEPVSSSVSLDTETDEGRPYSLQLCYSPGRAYMVLAENRTLLSELSEILRDQIIVMHNASFDLDICNDLGIRVDSFRDTMQELYHIGNLPQGLKQAVYRIFGYRMTSYDEVVTPHSKAALETWLAEALAHVSMEMRTEIREQLKTKVRVTMKPHEAEAVLRRVMGRLNSDYDPWEKPEQDKGVEKPRLIGRDWLAEVEAAVGRMPRKSIVHAPLDQQVKYACGDADWTLRLAGWLEGERKRIVQEEWRVT